MKVAAPKYCFEALCNTHSQSSQCVLGRMISRFDIRTLLNRISICAIWKEDAFFKQIWNIKEIAFSKRKQVRNINGGVVIFFCDNVFLDYCKVLVLVVRHGLIQWQLDVNLGQFSLVPWTVESGSMDSSVWFNAEY